MRDLLSYCRSILVSLHHHGFPEAIVAGGAIRDLDNGLGLLVKDIDIVVFDSPGYLRRLKMAMSGFNHRVAVREEVANYLAFENVACVHEFTDGITEKPIPIQIVVARHERTPMEILQRHDFGLCQIGFDGHSILKTDAYLQDQANSTFTLVRCRDLADLQRSNGRHARLSTEKYKGYPIVWDGNFTH